MDRFALVVMDLQAGVCARTDEPNRRGIFPKVRAALAAARDAGVPVIHVRVAFDEHYTLRTSRSPRFDQTEKVRRMQLGTPDVEFVPDAQPLPGEPVVTKGCVDPFIGTALMELLIGRRVGELYFAGVATNYVVESATRHAADTGFRVNVVEDCCASFDQAMHEFSIKILSGFGTICTADDFVARCRAGATT